MCEFKIGDKVKFNPKLFRAGATEFDKGVKSEGVITSFLPYETMHVDGICVFKAAFELIVPTGFEVGKKYVGKDKSWRNGIVILAELDDGDFAISYESTNEIKVDKIHPSAFQYYEEYIPPPPEEWRIVYKDQYGNITVGKTPFKSESEVKASRYWTDHSSSFKTIRVDA